MNVQNEHKAKFGDLVICLDKSVGGYWRKDVHKNYKGSRKVSREKSEIAYDEVFVYIDELIEQINANLPWRVISVDRAEADDIMMVLSKEFSPSENILIHSPDKDMIQCQRYNDNVYQYSALTKKWIVAENKNDNMQQWLLEHVCLGDAADEVPKVVDHTEFTEVFIEHLKDNDFTFTTPYEMLTLNKAGKLNMQKLVDTFKSFDIWKVNRKGESIGVKDIYLDIRFGPSNLQKLIKKYGSLDKWLDSHPLYRQHYERNFTLVMDDGIPSDIWNKIILAYKQSKTDYNALEFEKYLDSRNLSKIKTQLPSVFKLNRELTLSDFDW